MATIEERVKQCVAIQFAIHPEQLNASANLAVEYGMDDLDQIEITICVEDEFGIYIDDEQMLSFCTTQNIIDHVRATVPA